MVKVSIIVPIYKAEKYLRCCVDSILDQTFTDWELLLVDDGSPDRSGLICDEYAQKDVRIRVFHKKNGGVSSARNLGLNNVRGEYVMFVDADDWISNNAIERCSSYFDKYEIIRFSMQYVKSLKGKNNRNFLLSQSNSKIDILKRILERKSLLCVCGAFYKTDLFKNPSIYFDPKLVMAEDWLVLCQLVYKCHHIIDLPHVCYYYNQMNEGSCSNNPSSEKVTQCLAALYMIMIRIHDSKLYINSFVKSYHIVSRALFRSVLNESNSPKDYMNNFKKNEYFTKVLELLYASSNCLNAYNRCFLKIVRSGFPKYICSLLTCFNWIKCGYCKSRSAVQSGNTF